jgi:hypothetical protein
MALLEIGPYRAAGHNLRAYGHKLVCERDESSQPVNHGHWQSRFPADHAPAPLRRNCGAAARKRCLGAPLNGARTLPNLTEQCYTDGATSARHHGDPS